MNTWVKSELAQAKIMIIVGIVLLIILYFIYRSQNELLRGSMIPMVLLLVALIGYGAYIMQSRPAHAKDSIALYEKSKSEGIEKEIAKHTSDNKSGKTLIKFVYPVLIILSAIALFFLSSLYYKGMAIGFIILFVGTFIMDSGFVSRSDAFIKYLNGL